jgi:hypothetical protein
MVDVGNSFLMDHDTESALDWYGRVVETIAAGIFRDESSGSRYAPTLADAHMGAARVWAFLGESLHAKESMLAAWQAHERFFPENKVFRMNWHMLMSTLREGVERWDEALRELQAASTISEELKDVIMVEKLKGMISLLLEREKAAKNHSPTMSGDTPKKKPKRTNRNGESREFDLLLYSWVAPSRYTAC